MSDYANLTATPNVCSAPLGCKLLICGTLRRLIRKLSNYPFTSRVRFSTERGLLAHGVMAPLTRAATAVLKQHNHPVIHSPLGERKQHAKEARLASQLSFGVFP
jgi:hypothetical protein